MAAGLQTRLIGLLAGDLEAQVATYLLRAGTATGQVEITQAQLVSMLGAQRTSVQRLLKNLENAGLVEVGYGGVELVDAAGLASLLDDT